MRKLNARFKTHDPALRHHCAVCIHVSLPVLYVCVCVCAAALGGKRRRQGVVEEKAA